MTDGLYVGMNGAAARVKQLDTIADNLANADTPGFMAGQPRFESFLPPNGSPHSPQYVAATSAGVDTRHGDPEVTGRPLDVRTDNDLFITVINPADKSLAYTRAGRLEISSDGTLTSGGRTVLGVGGGPIILPTEGAQVRIDNTGTIFSNDDEIDSLALATLTGPLERVGPGIVVGKGAAPPLPGQARVHVGELEGSNAPALESTVQLISAQRAYDHAMQAIQASRRLDEKSVEMARIRG